jgi:hypothetical protein
MNIFGFPERSTYHTTCVNRVKSHLKRICAQAGKEMGFVPGRITDAWGYDKKTNTIYFCEIKVNPGDLLKAVSQIHDTVFRFKPKDAKSKVIPVIAVPKRLYNDMAKYEAGQLASFRSLCKTQSIAIWIIEQSNIRQIQGPKPKSPLKVKAKAKLATTAKSRTSKPRSRAKVKATIKRKTTAKAKTSPKSKASSKSSVTKPKSRAKAPAKRTSRSKK